MALWGICTSTSEVLQRRSGVRQSYDTARIVCCRGSSDIRRAERVKRGEEEEEEGLICSEKQEQIPVNSFARSGVRWRLRGKLCGSNSFLQHHFQRPVN